MLVELHMIQNFAPANLNRDDTGSPKDCEFGGYRRARISSQCLKRAVRTAFREHALVPDGQIATRTKRLVDEASDRLVAPGRNKEEAKTVVEAALKSVGLTVDEKTGKTQYLLYLGKDQIERIVDVCSTHWDALVSAAPAAEPQAGRTSARDTKRAAKKAAPEVGTAVLSALEGGRAADLALFGRMLADLPERNIEAAGQVAHALSTNKVSVEFDFYTAVDDLKPEDTAGADMLGTVEFNSACFYRYANVDTRQLTQNLGGDQELARGALEAFLRASIWSVPTGKQNSFAAHNPPSLVFTVVRERGAWSLANAFVRPIQPDSDGDLVQNSIGALDRCWGELTTMYGEAGIRGRWVTMLGADGLNTLAANRVGNVDELVTRTVAEAFANGQQGGGV
ncbi:MAG: type I-E CRISPR-associated protein Cas7/Cse4/CasC [Dehalococcoidia bacterium]